MLLSKFIQQSAHSHRTLWLLNFFMSFLVPFNRPHRFKICAVNKDYAETFAPYRRRNFNHVRGIHACALATVGELSAGLLLMYHFPPEQFRVIMSRMQIDYHYQAKKDVRARATMTESEIDALKKMLNDSGKPQQTITTIIKDTSDALIATVATTWQIKSWSAVNTAR